MRIFGPGGWVDLSTGINPCPYAVPELPEHAWSVLPTRTDLETLETAAARAYDSQAAVVALAGAQAAIQLVPRLIQPGRACVVGPTYNEHAAALQAQGWVVETISEPAQGAGADLVTVVNPNNPDGRRWAPEALASLQDKVGLLVVDESFADTEPHTSMAPRISMEQANTVVLRSFGKFYGLAGLRLGFAITGKALAIELRALAGPWAVSGPAIAVGVAAVGDTTWQSETRQRLARDAARLDALATRAGWRLVGGTDLFRTYDTPDAAAIQTQLAQHRVWSRIFPYSERWIRLGLPGTDADWAQVEHAMAAF